MAKSAPPANPGRGGNPGRTGNARDRLAASQVARGNVARRRTIRLLVICVVVAGLVLAAPIYLYYQDYQARNGVLADFGVSAESAGCDPVVSEPANGNQDHRDDGTVIEYPKYPPDSGPHYVDPAPFTKHFYAAADRPAVSNIVHNLEHGYTVVWYRDSAEKDQIDALQKASKTFGSDEYDPAKKFIAAPWGDSDPQGFPDGKSVVMTRWTANPDNPSDTAQQQGVRQACTSVSGPAIKAFMDAYPFQNAPEPNGA